MPPNATVMAVGDTAPHVEPPESIFRNTAEVLDEADVTIGQVERLFSEKGEMQRSAMSTHSKMDPRYVNAYSKTGFDVLSLASNHSMDFSGEALVNSMENFRAEGMETIGVGRDIKEAREPVVLERNGVSIAFLGYCSVLLPGYQATDDLPGVAPLRANTYYEPYEYQPGSPARIITEPWEEDVKAMVRDVKEAKREADFEVMSNHWGIHFIPRGVKEYQREIAHEAIDAGVDLILGHHPHILHGIEVYDETPILYSLGNFAFSRHSGAAPKALPQRRFDMDEVYNHEYGPDEGYHRHDHSPLTGIAKATFSEGGDVQTSILPAYTPTEPDGTPFITDADHPTVLLEESDSEFQEVADFLKWSSEPFGTELQVENGEIRVPS